MKKLLAAMLAVAMIFSMSCLVMAEENTPLPDGVVTFDVSPVENGQVVLKVNIGEFTSEGAADVIVVRYDSSALELVKTRPASLDNCPITFNADTDDEFSMNGVGHVGDGFINIAIGAAWESPVHNMSTKTAYTFTFNVKDSAAGADSIRVYHGDKNPEDLADEDLVSVSSPSAPADPTDAPNPPEEPTETPAPAESTEAPAPAATDKPADTNDGNGAGTNTNNGSSTGTGTSTSTGSTGTSTGSKTSGSSSSASSTTAAKTADTAPVVTMAVLALAAGTVVVAMRKRVNG